MFRSSALLAFITACLIVKHTVCEYENDLNLGSRRDVIGKATSPCLNFLTAMQITKSQQKGPVCRNKLVLLYICSLLLANSYAPEPNPGPRPIKFPCGICKKAVRWNTPGICCDECDTWYHQHCMGMADQVYDGLRNVSWECLNCGLPNFTSSLFDTTIFETSNVFTYLSETTSDSEVSFSNPMATSSPCKDAQRRKDLPLRIVIVNCQSAKASGKSLELQNLINSSRADIILGTESWLNTGISSAEVFPPGFQVYRKDRTKGPGGGVFILVSDRIHSEEPEELLNDGDCEMVWVKIKVQGSKDLYICSFYRSPSNHDPNYLEELRNLITRVPNHRGSHMWIGGDFNLPDINWEEDEVKQYATHCAQSHQLLNLSKDFYLEQVVREATRTTQYSSNILDLFFTNNDTLINQVHTIPGISDHDAVFIESSLRPFPKNETKRKFYKYARADYTSIKEELKEFTQTFNQDINSSMDINTVWLSLKNKIKELMDKHIPQGSAGGNKHQQPWINKHIKSLRRRKMRLFNRQRTRRKKEDIKKFKDFRTLVQKEERKAYWKYIENIIVPNTNEDKPPPKQKKLWSYIKSKRKDNIGVAPLKDNGKMHADARDKANILNKQYESVFTREDLTNIPTPEGKPFPSMPDIEISADGVLKLLRNLNPYKASGPDMISARLLKDLAEDMAPILTSLFKRSLYLGTVPEDWRHAFVTAIFKKGERFKASNYRPVSLTSICCKIQEHIIASSVMKHLEKYQILTDCQHGFRSKRGCETQLLCLAHELASTLDKRGKRSRQIDMVVLDFSKAFDRVPHQRLLSKLNHYGVRGKTIQWIESFLSDRRQQVICEGATSDDAPVVSGVPQGTVLGPILFLIFINDLPEHVQSNTRLFADDCVLYREIQTQEDQLFLQKDLDSLAMWERKWGMSFHPEKCSTIHITKSKSKTAFTYRLKGQSLQETDSTRYLGVDITSDLSWNEHINRTVKKANSMLGFLQRNLRINSRETKTAAYHALVRSNLDYCATVWNPHTASSTKKIEMVQRRAARYVTNRSRNTSSVTSMLEELGWEDLHSRRIKQQLVMLYKIINKQVDIPADRYITPLTTSTRKKHTRMYRMIPASTDTFKFSFFPSTVVHWNMLPASVAEAPDLASFRQGLSALRF